MRCTLRTNVALLAVLAASIAAPNPARAETLSVDGTELSYEEGGEGDVVLFVHGAISDRRVWRPLRDAIVAERRFVAYDQRYFGTSAWPDEGAGFGIETHVGDLIGVVEALGAGPVHLVTWSYGGEVGAIASARRPELFRSIVHFEPAVETLHQGLSGERAAIVQLAARFGPAVTALESGDDETATMRFLDAVFMLPPGSSDDFPEPWPTIFKDNARTIAPYLSMQREPFGCADLASVTAPTLVVQGSESFVIDAMMADEVVRCQPNALSVTMDGVRHDGPYREPDALAETVLQFVALVD